MGIFGVFKIFLLRFAVTFVFTLLIALLFQFSESSIYQHSYASEDDRKNAKNAMVLAKFKQVMTSININISFNDFHVIWRHVQELEQEIKRFEEKSSGWSILKSFYFTMTIITTVGYGDVTPKTKEGMYLSIVTGFLGIPIMMLTLKSLGELINDLIYKLVRFTEVNILKRRAQQNYNGKVLFVTLLMMFALVVGGGRLEQQMNDFTLLEGSYAWFITMSTIGFGDFVVSKSHIQGEDGSHEEKETLIETIGLFMLLTFGLGVVASVINAVSEFYETNKTVKRVLRCCFGVSDSARHTKRRVSTFQDVKRSIMSVARKITVTLESDRRVPETSHIPLSQLNGKDQRPADIILPSEVLENENCECDVMTRTKREEEPDRVENKQ